MKSFSPPQFPELYCVGWVKSAHGIRGELFVRLHAGQADWAEDADTLVLLPQGKSTPITFDILNFTRHKDGYIARLDGVTDRNRAEELARSAVYIDEKLLESGPGETVYLKQIEGFVLVDKNEGEIGRISGFATNGPQDLLRIARTGGGEALVPLVDAFLIHIDFDKHQVHMDLPPGLLSLEA